MTESSREPGLEVGYVPTGVPGERSRSQTEFHADHDARREAGELRGLVAGLGWTELVIGAIAVAGVLVAWIAVGAWLGVLVALGALLVLGALLARPRTPL